MTRPEELDVDVIIGQYLSEGMKVGAIAELHGCAPSSVYAVLQRNGIPVREKGRLIERVEEFDGLVKEYYESPDPLAVICARYGTNPARLYKEIGLRGLTVRGKRRRRGLSQITPQVLKETLDERGIGLQGLIDD